MSEIKRHVLLYTAPDGSTQEFPYYHQSAIDALQAKIADLEQKLHVEIEGNGAARDEIHALQAKIAAQAAMIERLADDYEARCKQVFGPYSYPARDRDLLAEARALIAAQPTQEGAMSKPKIRSDMTWDDAVKAVGSFMSRIERWQETTDGGNFGRRNDQGISELPRGQIVFSILVNGGFGSSDEFTEGMRVLGGIKLPAAQPTKE